MTAFVETLTHRIYDTDAAKALQTRLLKNRSRLFTFIHRDGVSWSNNLAENAIKQFGYYRDDVGRSVKEAGLSEYLVLLSLYQTCRVRGLSFLKFLLSRERDIDMFFDGKRPRRRARALEMYPKGYLPPSLLSLRRGRRKMPASAAVDQVESL